MTTLPPRVSLDPDTVVRALEDLGAQRAVAIRVLYVADDPNARASDLAAVVAGDPVLTAQVMRLANSAYYGLSGRVGSAEFAVSVLGFALVRCVAATHAIGGIGTGGGPSSDFWSEAGMVAAATAEAGSMMGVPRPEAFSLGLLHDLGRAVLRGIDPQACQAISEAPGPEHEQFRLALEDRAFGMDHAAVGAVVLEAWRFPEPIVEAVATHHQPLVPEASPARRALVAGLAIAELVEWEEIDAFAADPRLRALQAQLETAGLDLASGFEFSRFVRDQAPAISQAFSTLAA